MVLPSDLMTRKQAAAYLGVTPGTLAVWKTKHRYSLPMIKVGKLAKYRKADLDAWIESRRVVPGEEAPPAH